MAGIYIHIPFCKQACHYCNFHFSTSLKHKQEMLQTLQTELILRKNELTKPVETIYFGGGTPSLLTSDELRLLINKVYENYNVIDKPEITIEANPDDLLSSRAQSRDIFENYKQIGINRLSIGIQSFFEEDLKLMNRAHNAQEAKQCLDEAMKHFENVSVDLIYGIQNQSDEQWQENLEIALSYNVPHISSYALTVEPKTALDAFIKKDILPDVDDDQAQRQFHMMVDLLTSKDFVHYEISNFGKEGYFSKNNTAYWQQKEYLGIGPSAHSYCGKQRSWNIANNSKYIKAIKENILPNELENLSQKDQFNEYIMTGLRTIWGVSENYIENQFGSEFVTYFEKVVSQYVEEHLIFKQDDVYRTTKKGKFLVDGIASTLFMI